MRFVCGGDRTCHVPFFAVRGRCFGVVAVVADVGFTRRRGDAERACMLDLPKLQPGSRSKDAKISAIPRLRVPITSLNGETVGTGIPGFPSRSEIAKRSLNAGNDKKG
jgi:hypothetical protein